MGNIFDSIKRQAFDVVTQTMGYNASWQAFDSGSILSNGTIYTARVGFMDPSEKQELSGIESWNPDEPFMEYRIGFFPGLKESVDDANLEHIEIADIGYFSIKEVKTKYDGETFVARLIREVKP